MYYNRSVNNISTTNITNVYNKTVINNVSVTRVSYNGGSGGVQAQPSAFDQQAARERHLAVTPVQAQHIQAARSNPVLRASQNNGRPPIAATARPAAFTGAGVVQATRGGAVHNPSQPQARGERAKAPAEQQRSQAERAPMERPPPPRPPVEQQRAQAERAPMERPPPPRPPVEQRPQAERPPPPRPPARDEDRRQP